MHPENLTHCLNSEIKPSAFLHTNEFLWFVVKTLVPLIFTAAALLCRELTFSQTFISDLVRRLVIVSKPALNHFLLSMARFLQGVALLLSLSQIQRTWTPEAPS